MTNRSVVVADASPTASAAQTVGTVALVLVAFVLVAATIWYFGFYRKCHPEPTPAPAPAPTPPLGCQTSADCVGRLGPNVPARCSARKICVAAVGPGAAGCQTDDDCRGEPGASATARCVSGNCVEPPSAAPPKAAPAMPAAPTATAPAHEVPAATQMAAGGWVGPAPVVEAETADEAKQAWSSGTMTIEQPGCIVAVAVWVAGPRPGAPPLELRIVAPSQDPLRTLRIPPPAPIDLAAAEPDDDDEQLGDEAAPTLREVPVEPPLPVQAGQTLTFYAAAPAGRADIVFRPLVLRGTSTLACHYRLATCPPAASVAPPKPRLPDNPAAGRAHHRLGMY